MPNNSRSIVMALFGLVIIGGTAFGIWPVHVTVLGTEGSCGLAPVAWFQYAGSDPTLGTTTSEQSTLGLERECSHLGAQRTIVGVVIAGGGLIGLLIARATMPRSLPWWDGQRWRVDPMVPMSSMPPPPAARAMPVRGIPPPANPARDGVAQLPAPSLPPPPDPPTWTPR